ncbi:MAG: efflux RND transporter periplasmic adaptor subunit [Deltaproteobacteria bacterium]|nr:efflux RND transporter periplasmic adaptor subunit [Deltaproteobacteria bacterium]
MTMTQSRSRNVWPATLALLFATVGGGFTMGYMVAGKKPADPSVVPAAQSRPQGPTRVHLPPSLRENAGVRVEPIARQTLSPQIELWGSVDFDPDLVADVGGRISGRISQVFVRTGAEVRVGDPLLSIMSASLGELLASSLSSRAQLASARAHLARLASLSDQQLVTGVELDEARARVGTLNAEIRGVSQRLRAMGGQQASASTPSVMLRAPIAGRVVTRNAFVGQVIDPTDTVIRVADLSRVLVALRVFERDVSRIAVGDRVEIHGESMQARTVEGVVASVGSVIARETRTSTVEVRVPNPERLLRPGQFVNARVSVRGPQRAVLSIPRSAVILLEGQPTVFVEVEPNWFEPRPIATRDEDSDRFEITRGVREGERVAVDGVFALKSELQR